MKCIVAVKICNIQLNNYINNNNFGEHSPWLDVNHIYWCLFCIYTLRIISDLFNTGEINNDLYFMSGFKQKSMVCREVCVNVCFPLVKGIMMY